MALCRKTVKAIAFQLLYVCGITRFVAWCNRKRLVILCYHGVTERSMRHPRDRFGLHVRHDRFVAQMDYLQRHYRVIALPEYLKAREEERALPPYSVVLTFDDGFRNFLTAALPRLAQRRLPVTMFLITDLVGDGPTRPPIDRWHMEDDETHLSWTEVKHLQQHERVIFGSHTRSHAKLPDLLQDAVAHELRDSYAAIRSHLPEYSSVPLAYPYGRYSDRVIEQARAIGYVCGLTCDIGGNHKTTDLFLLQRVLIGDDDTRAAFAARVAGITWGRRR